MFSKHRDNENFIVISSASCNVSTSFWICEAVKLVEVGMFSFVIRILVYLKISSCIINTQLLNHVWRFIFPQDLILKLVLNRIPANLFGQRNLGEEVRNYTPYSCLNTTSVQIQWKRCNLAGLWNISSCFWNMSLNTDSV